MPSPSQQRRIDMLGPMTVTIIGPALWILNGAESHLQGVAEDNGRWGSQPSLPHYFLSLSQRHTRNSPWDDTALDVGQHGSFQVWHAWVLPPSLSLPDALVTSVSSRLLGKCVLLTGWPSLATIMDLSHLRTIVPIGLTLSFWTCLWL